MNLLPTTEKNSKQNIQRIIRIILAWDGSSGIALWDICMEGIHTLPTPGITLLQRFTTDQKKRHR
jgi:hypothetical protein